MREDLIMPAIHALSHARMRRERGLSDEDALKVIHYLCHRTTHDSNELAAMLAVTKWRRYDGQEA